MIELAKCSIFSVFMLLPRVQNVSIGHIEAEVKVPEW